MQLPTSTKKTAGISGKVSERNESELSGLQLCYELYGGHNGQIGRLAWSREGEILATCSEDKLVGLWKEGQLFGILKGHNAAVCDLSWEPFGTRLATASEDFTTRIWNVNSKSCSQCHVIHSGKVFAIAWITDGLIASGGEDNVTLIWEPDSGKIIRTLRHAKAVRKIAVNPGSSMVAIATDDRTISLWDANTGLKSQVLAGHTGELRDICWLGDAQLASSATDQTIRIWTIAKGEIHVKVLEGHTQVVTGLSVHRSGDILASTSWDNTIRFWDLHGLKELLKLPGPNRHWWPAGVAFSPVTDKIATLAPTEVAKEFGIRVWNIKAAALSARQPQDQVQCTSAKIVLVGESEAGKSCLAMRIAERRYPSDAEKGSTHGLRFWYLTPQDLDTPTERETLLRHEIILWDMGGQQEYRLVHQLFLHDTTVALIIFDPSRGRKALDDVYVWNLMLENQLRGRRIVKLLVGTKVDSENSLIDRIAVDKLVTELQFERYIETSALADRGIAELRTKIAASVDWTQLSQTKRPQLFQAIRDRIETDRLVGTLFVGVRELTRLLRNDGFELSEETTLAVARQLALQGIVALTTNSYNEDVIMLQVGEIERYAGSLILLARDNPRLVPAIEETRLRDESLLLPGIDKKSRLSTAQEHLIIGLVTQLMIQHGLCFRHAGLLIFPSLYRATEPEADSGVGSTCLYYDFSGAIDNIYASLVAWLAIARDFGRVRLWDRRAEFVAAEHGVCGVRKILRGKGFAHLEIYFDEKTPQNLKDLFVSFVEDHLARNGVEVTEHLFLKCNHCGNEFSEESLRKRVALGKEDIGCVTCDARGLLSDCRCGTVRSLPEISRQRVALRTRVEEGLRADISAAKAVFSRGSTRQTQEALTILHLSDLHFTAQTDVEAKLFQLITDVKGVVRKRELPNDSRVKKPIQFHSPKIIPRYETVVSGLGIHRLDYLIISGDLTNGAAPHEFELAQKFVSGLVAEFGLTAERCIIVPGNHDVMWDNASYTYLPIRSVNPALLAAGTFVQQGEVYLLRNADQYTKRFRAFSSSFFHPLLQVEYPQSFEDQGIPYFFPDDSLQVLAFNSCWQIDEWYRGRSGMHPRAIVNCLKSADAQLKRIGKAASEVLRVAVWHHPITGNEKIEDDAFMSQLTRAGVRIILHGHVHEQRADKFRSTFSGECEVIGAGSFSAPSAHRPESIPRLYNLIQLERSFLNARVHTRCLYKETGAWDGWAVWPGGSVEERKTYYEFPVREEGFSASEAQR